MKILSHKDKDWREYQLLANGKVGHWYIYDYHQCDREPRCAYSKRKGCPFNHTLFHLQFSEALRQAENLCLVNYLHYRGERPEAGKWLLYRSESMDSEWVPVFEDEII